MTDEHNLVHIDDPAEDDDVVRELRRDPETFFGKHGLMVPEVGGPIEAAAKMRLGFDGRLYRYDGGVYRPDGERFAAAETRRLLGERFRASHQRDVAAWLRSVEPTIPERPPEQWINVRNGLLDWREERLSDHTPDVPSTVQLPVRWDHRARCPAIETFLSEVLPEDTIELVYELIGYTLYPGNPLRKAVLLLGPGGNGKSVLLDVVRALVGPRNVSSVPLQTLGENRFAAAELVGKLANVCGDLDARAVRTTDLFKMATGGDPVMADRKNREPFTFTPYATFWFAANEAPISSDQTEAWFDRWIVLPLENRIPSEAQDPKLRSKLTTPDELSGLLIRAIASLRQVMERGRFTLPQSVAEAGVNYRDELDSVRGFVADECVLHPEAWIKRSRLYEVYASWCREGGRRPLARTRFYKQLRRNWPSEVWDAGRHGTRGFTGIGLAHHGGDDGAAS